jgi:hypothetical protein
MFSEEKEGGSSTSTGMFLKFPFSIPKTLAK